MINVKNIGYGNLILNDLDYVPAIVCSRLSNHLLKEGDIVFGRKGSVDRHCYIKKENEDWMQGSDCIRVRVEKGVNSRYLSYYLMLDRVKKQINNSAVGSTMASINTDILKTVEIILPEPEEQNLIATLLSKIDEKIENNNKINAELESMAKTIYDYWFLQFEFPNEEGKPYKSSGGKMVWNEELKREIPEGWQVKGLEDFGLLSNGINYDKDEVGDKKYKIINVRNISSSSLFVYKADLDEIVLEANVADKYLLKRNDILIARSGIPGAVRILDDIDNTIYCGFIIRLEVTSDLYRRYLVYKLKDYENATATTSGGTIMQNVSQNTLKGLRFVIPNKKSILIFNQKIDSIWAMMKVHMNENEELISLRSYLLPLLMNGQIRFKE